MSEKKASNHRQKEQRSLLLLVIHPNPKQATNAWMRQ
jgi:hypothetical protein